MIARRVAWLWIAFTTTAAAQGVSLRWAGAANQSRSFAIAESAFAMPLPREVPHAVLAPGGGHDIDPRLIPSDDPDSGQVPDVDDVDSIDVVPRIHHTKRNVVLYLTGSVATLGVLWALPANTSKWSTPDHGWHHFLESFQSAPTCDTDPWGWNYVAHPIFGAVTYLMERDYDESPLRGFLFSAWASCMWEFVIEAPMEHPSTQDLIYTPILGSILGEGIYRLTVAMRQGGFNTAEKIAVTLINPVYVFQRGYK